MPNVTIGTPQPSNTLLGILQSNDRNLADFIVDDILESAPFLAAAYTQTATGKVEHKFEVEVEAPGVGFREVNTGRDNAAGKSKIVTIALMLLDASFERDVALALASTKGIEGYMASEGRKSLRAAFATLDRQLIRGTGAVADGFYGLNDFLEKFNPDMQIIKGSTAGSSVYMGHFGEDAVSVIAGNDGELLVDDIKDVLAYDSSNKPYNALSLPILGWLGLQVAGSKNLARLANVPQSGEGTLDDKMLAELLMKFPSAVTPNFVLMSRFDAANLAASRTATNPTGTPAPIPTVWDLGGTPMRIIIDDNVKTDEVVTTTTTASGD